MNEATDEDLFVFLVHILIILSPVFMTRELVEKNV